MMNRCYGGRLENVAYVGCTVAEEWHNFQNFAEWYENNYYLETMKGWALDKDILIKGNKIYSPETCCFIPASINSLFTKRQSCRGNYPIGVLKHGDRFTSYVCKEGKRKLLGVFNTPEEAFQTYKTAKEIEVKRVANIWKDLISEKIYKAMYNYKVEITD